MKTDEQNATVVGREDVGPDLIVLRVRPDRLPFPFEPGQFAVLGLPGRAARLKFSDPEETPPAPAGLLRRAYSIASSSRQNEYLEFYLKLVRSGALSPRLFALKPNDRLWLGPRASGHFTLEQVKAEHDLILVSTGTGLAPYISMIRSAHRCGEGRTFHVVHGARYSWDLGYRSELQALDHDCGTFRYLPTITRKESDPDWQGHVGRIQSLLDDGTLARVWGGGLDPARLSIFLCGSPEMVEEMQARFEGLGFSTKGENGTRNLFVERYW